MGRNPVGIRGGSAGLRPAAAMSGRALEKYFASAELRRAAAHRAALRLKRRRTPLTDAGEDKRRKVLISRGNPAASIFEAVLFVLWLWRRATVEIDRLEIAHYFPP